MKILILANNDVGLYKFRKELIERLVKDGNEVHVSLPGGNFIAQIVDLGCSFHETEVDRRGINPFTDSKLLYAYFRLINKLKPDLVITYTIKPNIYGGIITRMLGVKLAVNITGLGTAFQRNDILKKLVVFLYKQALKKAKVVFFENCENQDIFVNLRIVNKEKTVLLNGAGVNTDYFHYQEYPKDDKPTRFLFIGRVMQEKGVDELFEAMKRLCAEGYDCQLDVVGGLEENYKPILDKYELEGWLHYHGFQDDVRPFIKQCHCFVLPSWHEGMANTNLEAASSGRPVITSNIHGCMEAVEDGVSGYLVERKNAGNVYYAMKKFIMLSNRERKDMGFSGYKMIKSSFDKKSVVDATVKNLKSY